MARVREFDPDEALEKAMRLFWHKGYADTSVRDLVKHTGVAHAGLYQVFGDKRGLYRAALDHYNATYGNMLIGPLEQPESGRTEIEAFFKTLVREIKSKRFSDGCLMCNTGVEFGNADDDILKVSQDNFHRIKAGFKRSLAHARDCGEVRAELDPAATASFLTSVFHGIIVLARAKVAPRSIEQTVAITLKALD